MNVLDLSEKEIKKFKDTLIENGTIFETTKINKFDIKFFETVTISNTLIKFFLFFGLGVFILINIFGIVLSFVYNSPNKANQLAVVVGIFVICSIISAIFSNINTNKKKEENILYIKNGNFIFNFSDGVVETSNLFYSLPFENIKKIEFIIQGIRKNVCFGSVTFTFKVLDYEVNHAIRYTDLTKIEQFLKSNIPSLINNLIVDGKSVKDCEPVKNKKEIKFYLISFAVLMVAILLIVVPYCFNYFSVALIIASVVLMITAIICFLASFIYTYHLVQGTIISGIFIIMGFSIPLLIVENSGISFLDFVIQDNEILMASIFGIIGLCLFSYIINFIIGKLNYIIKKRKERE